MTDTSGSSFPIVEVQDDSARWFRWSGHRRDIFRPTSETFYWQFTLGTRLQCPHPNERERCLFAFVRELYDKKVGDISAQWTDGRWIDYQYANIKLGDVFDYYTTRGILKVPGWRCFAYAVEEFLEKDPRVRFLYPGRMRPLLEEKSVPRIEESGSGRKSNDQGEALLQAERAARMDDNKKFNAEISALMAENSKLIDDLTKRSEELETMEEQASAQKELIQGLEQALREEHEAGMQRLKDKQDQVDELMAHLQQSRRSSSATSSTVGFGPEDRLHMSKDGSRLSEAHEDEFDEEAPVTPGTPESSLPDTSLPPIDPRADHVVRDWTDDRSLRAARSFDEELALEKIHELIAKLPYESQENARHILTNLLDPASAQQVNESQILLNAVPTARQEELRGFLIPLLKAHHSLRITYATLERRTLVTDVRIKIERRRDSVLAGNMPGEKRFGKGHSFTGPSGQNAGELVPHSVRELSANKAIYVSKPKDGELVPDSSPREGSEHSTEDMDSSSEAGEVPLVSPSSRKWRGLGGGLGAAKLLGTMAAGAKQRVTTFKNSKFIHEGTSCQYCKMAPIVGERYSCERCVGFSLCKTCYSRGGHGLENSDDLFYCTEDLVLKRCSRLAKEIDLMELMRFEICRSNLRMYSFCLNWVADIVNGKSSRDLKARALEMPSITRDVRKIFVPMLMSVCSHRTDIKIMTEIELEDDSVGSEEDDGAYIETLRLWISDKYRSTSPFVQRDQVRQSEGEEGENARQSSERSSEVLTPRDDSTHHFKDVDPSDEKNNQVNIETF